MRRIHKLFSSASQYIYCLRWACPEYYVENHRAWRKNLGTSLRCHGWFLVHLALIVLTLGLLTSCGEEEEVTEEVVRPVRAIKVADADRLHQSWFSGRAQATQQIDLSFRVSGQLIERPVDIGTEVDEGQVVARIDPSTFQADLDQIDANLARARATQKNAEAQLERQRILTERGHQSEAALDQYIAAESEAKATVGAQQAASRRSRLDLEFTTLKAPFAGTVVQTYVENFQDVREKQPIIRLVDDSRIEMEVNIPESLIYVIPEITNVVAIFDAFPDLVVPAEVKEIGTEASETTRTYPVTLIMDQPRDAKILPGMAGRASGKGTEDTTDQIVVPSSSVFSAEDASRSFVWVIDEGSNTVSRREVSVGSLDNRGIKVVDGLSAGEWIAISGVKRLRDGQTVLIQPQ